MKGGAQFRGVSQDQDPKYKDKHQKLLRSMAFPEKFNRRIRRSSFKLEALRPWIARRVTELLEMDDEIVIEVRRTQKQPRFALPHECSTRIRWWTMWWMWSTPKICKLTCRAFCIRTRPRL